MLQPRCSPAGRTYTASVLTMLAAVAFWPTHAANAPEAAEQFTHVAGINLADLPSFDELAARFGFSPFARSGDHAERHIHAKSSNIIQG